MPEVRIGVEEAESTVRRAFERAGLTPDDARIVTASLVDAEITGRAGHGLSRVPGIATRVAGCGSDHIRIAADRGVSVTLDCGGALGYLAAHRAATIAIERLDVHPLVAVGCRRTSHAGAIGYYARLVAEAGHCAMAVAHCSPLLAPYGGLRAVFGTNPVAFACPGPRHPLVADLSPARITYGAMMNARHAGRPLPEDVAVGPDGAPTTDPDAALAGAVLPVAEAKGGALAFLIQVIAGPLCGADAVPEPGRDYGFFLLGMRADLFVDATDFLRGMERLHGAVHDAGARCPGEGSHARAAQARRDGIPCESGLWSAILELAG